MVRRHIIRKILFSIANIAVLIIGAVIIVIGFLSRTGSEAMSAELNNKLQSISYTVIVFGAGVIGVGILGMISVNCDIRILSFLYKIALLLTAALLILLGTSSLVMVGVLTVIVNSQMVDMMKGEIKRDKMDQIEKDNECCGVEGHMDLYDNLIRYPASCCSVLGIVNLCVKLQAFTKRCNTVWTNQRDEMLYYGGIAFIIVGAYCVVLAILVHWAERTSRDYRDD